jgi:hypothetical protein
MKIEDLIQLLNNRLREFKLSRDYSRMSGDLERMNVADKEIIGLEDTLYQLNLLVDTSKSVAVKESTLADVMTDGSVAILGEYDITSYATDPEHVEKIDDYIKSKYLSSPVTGEMITSATLAYTVDARLMMAIMEQDSSFGTAGVAVRTLNPGNVGNDDDGNTRTYKSWQEGVTAVAEWLSRHRISKIIPEITEDTVLESVATSTPSSMTPTTATTTPITATSTTTTVINIPMNATSTPITVTTTPITATSTTTTESITPVTDATSTTTTESITPITATATTTTSTSVPATDTATTPVTTTSIDSISPNDSGQVSPLQVTTTEETATTTTAN